MAEINKVETADGEVLIDLTADTVSEEDVNEGITFHSADGKVRTGTAPDKMPYISGKTPILLTDAEEAYSKETVFPYAAINSIGGKSVVWNQNCKNSAVTSTFKGITITNNGNGSLSVNGTATGRANFNESSSRLSIKYTYGHKYYLFGSPKGGSQSTYYVNASIYKSGDIYKSTPFFDYGNGGFNTANDTEGTYWSVEVVAASGVGQTVNNLVFKPRLIDLTVMFGTGNEPTTTSDPRIEWIETYAEAHPEYNAGEIISAEVEQVITRGKNLISEPMRFGNAENVNLLNRISNKSRVRVYEGETFTLTANAEYQLNFSIYSTAAEPSIYTERLYDSVWLNFSNGAITIIIPSTGYLTLNFRKSDNSVITQSERDDFTIMLEKGSTATEYKPHIEPQSYEIPSAIKQLDGYGWAAGNVYNEVDYAGKRFIRRVSRVDLGTLDYNTSASGLKTATLTGAIGAAPNVAANALCAGFEIIASSPITGSVNKNQIAINNAGIVYINLENKIVDVSEFKAAMSGVYLYYELSEPIITDISNIITDDFLIECESGGTVTFESESGLSVPNEVEYITEADFARRKVDKIDVLKVDNELSETSENPVQNKVITAALQNLPTGGLNFGTVSYVGTGTDIREIEFPVDIKLYSVSAYIPSSGNCFTTGIIPANSTVCVTPYWGERYSGIVGCNAEYHDQKLTFTRITGDTATNHNYPGEEVTVSYWY